MTDSSSRKSSGAIRRQFVLELGRGLKVVWPVLAGLLGVIAALGGVVALLEGWPLGKGIYFAFVTGLTIGYGDIVPTGMVSRLLAIAIGFTGILLAALIAAVGVQALNAAKQE